MPNPTQAPSEDSAFMQALFETLAKTPESVESLENKLLTQPSEQMSQPPDPSYNPAQASQDWDIPDYQQAPQAQPLATPAPTPPAYDQLGTPAGPPLQIGRAHV